MVPVIFDLGEDESRIKRFMSDRDYPWDPAWGEFDLFSSYRVLSRATKVAVDSDGVIVFRGGYGRMGLERWEKIFIELAGS